MCDGGHVKYGIISYEGIVSRVIAEWTFSPQLIGLHITFQDEFGFCRDLQVHRQAADHGNGLLTDESREENFVNAPGEGSRSGVCCGRVCADSHGYGHASAGLPVFLVVVRTVLVDVPVHPGSLAIEDLEPVHSRIASAGGETSSDDHRQGDERASILGPALQDREPREIHRISHVDDFLAGGFFHPSGKELEKVQSHGQKADDVLHRFGRVQLDESTQPGGQCIEVVDTQGHADASGAPEGIGQDGEFRTLNPFKKKRLASSRTLGCEVGNVSDFKVGGDRGLDPEELPGVIESRDKVLQVSIG
jgi:hypothetical protein